MDESSKDECVEYLGKIRKRSGSEKELLIEEVVLLLETSCDVLGET